MSSKLSQFFNYLNNHKKKLIIACLSFAVGAILFASVFFYVDYQEIGGMVWQFGWWRFLIFLAISCFVLILTALRWHIILRAYGIKIKFWRAFQYRLAGFGFSYMTPIAEFGGAPFRAYLLKKKGISFSKGLVTAIVDNFIEVFSQSIIVGVGVLFFASHFGFSQKMIWVLAITTFIFLAAALWLFLRLRGGKLLISPLVKIFGGRRTAKKLARIEKIFVDFFTEHKKAFAKTFLISFLIFIVSVVEVSILLYLMGLSLGILNTFLAKILLSIANLFPVPAALGVSEWVQTGFFGIISVSKSAGAVFSIIFKAKNIFYSLVGIGLFLYWWQKKVRWDKRLANFVRENIYAKIP